MKIIGAAVFSLLISISAIAQDQEAQNPPATTPEPAAGQSASPVHPGAVTYSDGYQLRAKIHKYASFATLPLFATEVILGQSLFNESTPAGSKRGIHAVVGAGIIGLFGYGVSLVLFVLALRHLGTARTGACRRQGRRHLLAARPYGRDPVVALPSATTFPTPQLPREVGGRCLQLRESLRVPNHREAHALVGKRV